MLTLQEIEDNLRSKISGEDHKRILESNLGYMAFHTLCTVILHITCAHRAEEQRALFLKQKEYRQFKRKNIHGGLELKSRPRNPVFRSLLSLISHFGKIPISTVEEIVLKAYHRDILRLGHIISSNQDQSVYEKAVRDFLQKYKVASKSDPSTAVYFPCSFDILSFISPLFCDDIGDHYKKYAFYPHITSEEFLERNYDYDLPPKYTNPLMTLYGDYINDFTKIIDKLNEKTAQKGLKTKFHCTSIDEVRNAIIEIGGVDFGESSFDYTDADDIEENPFRVLLVHPDIRIRFTAFANLDDFLKNKLTFNMILLASSIKE